MNWYPTGDSETEKGFREVKKNVSKAWMLVKCCNKCAKVTCVKVIG